MTAKIILSGTRYLCDSCKSVCYIPLEIKPEDIPLELTCPHCATRIRWKGYLPILQKIPPSANERFLPLQNWILTNANAEEHNPLEPAAENPQTSTTVGTQTSEIGTQTSETEEDVVPFWKLATDTGSLVKQLFQQIDLMKREVEKFQSTIGAHFLGEWAASNRFAQNWYGGYLQEFLEFPFTAIPVRCDDPLAAQYGRWILAPKFFNPGIGIKLHHTGGFRLELLNSYTRMMFPLETKWCDYLGIPPPLDLSVIENKIIGPSLPFCWRDIPGLVEDRDHTEDWTSVYMTRCQEARLWLAQHGVNPWGKRTIELPELNASDLEPEITKQPPYLRAWQKFCQQGRLAVFWPSIMESRKFAHLAAMMLKGVTCIFLAGHRDQAVWNNLFDSYSARMRLSFSKLVFFDNETPAMWDAILRSKSVVIDLAHGTDPAILDQFFNYHGRLMIINSDPIMDYFTTNTLIAKVFALTGSQVFEDANWENWPSHHVQNLDIASTFNGLVENWDRSKSPAQLLSTGNRGRPKTKRED